MKLFVQFVTHVTVKDLYIKPYPNPFPINFKLCREFYIYLCVFIVCHVVNVTAGHLEMLERISVAVGDFACMCKIGCTGGEF